MPDGTASGMILGVLRATPAFAGTQPVFQSQDIFGRGTTQRVIDTVELNKDPKPPIPLIEIPELPPMPAEWENAEQEDMGELPPLEGGVPDSQKLEIRLDDGTVLGCWGITIMRTVPRADMSDEDWRRESGAIGNAREAWCVSALVVPPT
jgi:hypothetical protein